MIEDLKNRINRLRTTKSKPVSFLFHTTVGSILREDHEALEELEQCDKIMADSQDITFII